MTNDKPVDSFPNLSVMSLTDAGSRI